MGMLMIAFLVVCFLDLFYCNWRDEVKEKKKKNKKDET